MPTPFMVLDIDGLDSTEQAAEVRERLSSDPNIETELCFISPKGAVVIIPIAVFIIIAILATSSSKNSG